MQQADSIWVQLSSKLQLDKWLPHSYSHRATVLVFSVLAATLLLLHSSAPWPASAAFQSAFDRISTVASSRWASPAGQLSSALCSEACPCACRRWTGPYGGDLPTPVVSNCGPMADRRGAHQNVISYSFFGTNATAYLSGVVRNAELALQHYPGWTVRVYYDGAANFSEWDKTACYVTCRFHHVDLCDVRHLPGLGDISSQTPTIWRFAVIADESVDRFLMRDLDSILTERENSAVLEWLASNKTTHIMRDHQNHTSEIIPGLWDGWNRYNEKYRVIRQQMIEAPNPGTHQLQWDRELLSTILWPELVRTGDVMSHDSYQCLRMPLTQPWPKQRNRTEFAGAPLVPEAMPPVKKCPMACRQPKRLDMDYC